MGFMDKVRDALGWMVEAEVMPAPDARESKALNTLHQKQNGFLLGVSGAVPWMAADYKTLSEEAYKKCVIAYRCVNEIAESFGQVPWVLYERTRNNRTQIYDHEVLRLLETPNPVEGGVIFRQNWVSLLQIAGMSFIESVRAAITGNGRPKELWLLPPNLMDLKFDEQSGRMTEWLFRPNERQIVRWPIDRITMKSDVAFTKLFNPDASDWKGYSPMAAARRKIATFNTYEDWNKNLLDNSAVPSGALTVTDEMDDEEFETLKAEFASAYQGATRSRRPMVLEGGMTWVPMSFAPTDMDWLKGNEVTALDICRAFGVPGPLLSITDPTYNNYKEAKILFLENRIVSLLEMFKWELNRWLLPMFPGTSNMSLEYNLAAVPAFAERRDLLWERAEKSADILTINERRAMLDYAPIPAGNVVMVPAAFIPLDIANHASLEDLDGKNKLASDQADDVVPVAKGKMNGTDDSTPA